jgi:hypothetical protein
VVEMTMDVQSWLRKQLEEASPDLLVSRRFEIGSGLALLAVVVATRGPLDPAVLGAVASSAPDLEHVLRLPRPRGRKLFPTHRFGRLHRRGGVRASVQLLVAGAIVGATIADGVGARAISSSRR